MISNWTCPRSSKSRILIDTQEHSGRSWWKNGLRHWWRLILKVSISIHQSIDRSIYLSIYLSIYPSIDLSMYLFIYMSIYLSIAEQSAGHRGTTRRAPQDNQRDNPRGTVGRRADGITSPKPCPNDDDNNCPRLPAQICFARLHGQIKRLSVWRPLFHCKLFAQPPKDIVSSSWCLLSDPIFVPFFLVNSSTTWWNIRWLIYFMIWCWSILDMTNIEAFWSIVSRDRCNDLWNRQTWEVIWWWVYRLQQTMHLKVRGSVRHVRKPVTTTIMVLIMHHESVTTIADSGPNHASPKRSAKSDTALSILSRASVREATRNLTNAPLYAWYGDHASPHSISYTEHWPTQYWQSIPYVRWRQRSYKSQCLVTLATASLETNKNQLTPTSLQELPIFHLLIQSCSCEDYSTHINDVGFDHPRDEDTTY